MTVVAVTGDCATTTSVALAAVWPGVDSSLLIECDPSGGDVAAWFDMPVEPSLSTVVTTVLDGSWPAVRNISRVAESGIRTIPAPARRVEAAQALQESGRSIAPSLARMESPIVIADIGKLPDAPLANPFLGCASVAVVVHRQAVQSSRAAAVRLQRLADQIELMSNTSTSVVVAVVGNSPFGVDEIGVFLTEMIEPGLIVGLPVDQLAAATLGGRVGLSRKRLARQPLMRSASELAGVIGISLEQVAERVGGPTR